MEELMSSNESLLGQYDFNQNIEINILAEHENGIETTMIHELVHLMLTQNTDFGKFTSFVSKLAVLKPMYKK